MKKILIAVGVLAAVGLIVFAAVGRKKVVGEGVYMGTVSRGDVVTIVTGTGVIQPRTRVNVSSEIYGQIVAIPVKEGETIRKGDLLVRIDPEKYRSDVDRLAANVRVDRIAIESEEVSLKNLEIDQRRASELYRQGVISISEKERADLAVDSSRIRLKSLRESVTQVEAGLSRANVDLSKATIYAPMSGKVTQVNTEVGEQVIVGTTNIPGSVLMVISDMSEVLAEVNVDETEVVRLKPGQRVKVTVDAVEKVTYEGHVTEIRNTARREGEVNVFGVKVLLQNPDERLRPGMTAKAKIEVERRENVLRVPIQAVTTRERKKLQEEKKAAASKMPPGAGASSSAAKATTKDGAGAASSGGKEAGGEGSQGGGGEETAKSAGASEGSGTEVVSQTTSTRSGDADGGRRSEESASARSGKGHEAADKASAGAGAGQEPGRDAKGDRDEIEVVYVVEKDMAKAVPVKTAATDELFVEIQEGLDAGATVITGPYRALKKLKEGARVMKKEETEIEGEEGGSGSGGPTGDTD